MTRAARLVLEQYSCGETLPARTSMRPFTGSPGKDYRECHAHIPVERFIAPPA